MSQHGRHSGGAETPRRATMPAAGASAARRERKLGPVSMETLLVLALVCLIAGGSVLVNRVDPGHQSTKTINGGTTIQTTTLGQGGIQPGEIQARTITPTHVAASDDEVSSGAVAAPTPKPLKPVKGKATAAPTVPSTGTVAAPAEGNPAADSPAGKPPAGGGSSGGGRSCTGLGSLLGNCPAQSGPQAGATSENPPGQ